MKLWVSVSEKSKKKNDFFHIFELLFFFFSLTDFTFYTIFAGPLGPVNRCFGLRNGPLGPVNREFGPRSGLGPVNQDFGPCNGRWGRLIEVLGRAAA